MLDIKFIIENIDIVKEAIRKKKSDVNLDTLLLLDTKRRKILQSMEAKQQEQNEVSKKMVTVTDDRERGYLIVDMKKLKDSIQKEQEKLKTIMTEWKSLMLQVPNVPDMSVPEGSEEKDNVEIKTWGEKPNFDFQAKDHIEIMNALDMVDFERGTKVHGFRGYFLKNDGALLSWAIWNYAQKFFLNKGFNPFIAPAIVKKEFFYGTGHLPGDANDLYKTQDGDYLSGTAEVPMMALHANEILKKEDLPLRYLAFSPCYRREAGSHGRDTKGLIRVHEFYKLEQLVICEASHTESVKFHEELNRNTEEFIESLKTRR
mgnify:CR=1 FL=1